MKFGKTLYKKVKMETQRRHLQLKKEIQYSSGTYGFSTVR